MINEICTECGGQGGDVVNGPFCPNCGGTGQTISKIDGILEELHNSWLDDDYEFDDPCGVHAKQAIEQLIAEAYKKGRIDGSIEVINGTCEICHAYPMTVDCNNAGCDK